MKSELLYMTLNSIDYCCSDKETETVFCYSGIDHL